MRPEFNDGRVFDVPPHIALIEGCLIRLLHSSNALLAFQVPRSPILPELGDEGPDVVGDTLVHFNQVHKVVEVLLALVVRGVQLDHDPRQLSDLPVFIVRLLIDGLPVHPEGSLVVVHVVAHFERKVLEHVVENHRVGQRVHLLVHQFEFPVLQGDQFPELRVQENLDEVAVLRPEDGVLEGADGCF